MSMISEQPIGALNFNVLREVLEELSILQVNAGAEIGVFDGGTSMFLLRAFPKLTLFSVDPYKAYHEYDQARLNEAESNAAKRLAEFGQRSIRVKMSSVEAAAKIPDETLDFVFIDGDHTYEAVKRDIEAWYPKVRRGGFFSGHDFRWDGVTKAVEEFAHHKNMAGIVSPKESDIWYFVKP